MEAGVREYKKFYDEIKAVVCPYFGGEKVVFNRKGFNHLIRLGKNKRPLKEQNDRLPLLKYCREILGGNFTSVEFRIEKKYGKEAYFWGFTSLIAGISMRLVVRQIGSGRKSFFSIFPIQH